MSWWKLSIVLVGSLVVTALGIDAEDTVTGSRFTLLASLVQSHGTTEHCPSGMVPVKNETTTVCVDTYEAGVGTACPITVPASALDTLTNAGRKDCLPVSKTGVLPWRYHQGKPH